MLELIKKKEIILGIDPSHSVIGFGLIKVYQKIELLLFEELLLGKLKNSNSRFKKIFEKTLSLIDAFHPNELAIEAPFLGKNIQSMLKLVRAQAVMIAAGLYRNLSVVEYSPRIVKMALSGRGHASKKQIYELLKLFFKGENWKKNFDACDGLSVAICHFLNKNFPIRKIEG